jgi:hypothetical protein
MPGRALLVGSPAGTAWLIIWRAARPSSNRPTHFEPSFLELNANL